MSKLLSFVRTGSVFCWKKLLHILVTPSVILSTKLSVCTLPRSGSTCVRHISLATLRWRNFSQLDGFHNLGALFGCSQGGTHDLKNREVGLGLICCWSDSLDQQKNAWNAEEIFFVGLIQYAKSKIRLSFLWMLGILHPLDQDKAHLVFYFSEVKAEKVQSCGSIKMTCYSTILLHMTPHQTFNVMLE